MPILGNSHNLTYIVFIQQFLKQQKANKNALQEKKDKKFKNQHIFESNARENKWVSKSIFKVF